MNGFSLNRLAQAARCDHVLQVAAVLASQLLMLDVACGQQAIVPTCLPFPETYRISDDGKGCVPNASPDDFKTVKAFCDTAHGTLIPATNGKVEACALPAVTPSCPSGGGIAYSSETKQCVRNVSASVSDPSNYVHDCIKVLAPIKGASLQKPKSEKAAKDGAAGDATAKNDGDDDRFYVSWQSKDGKQIDLVPAKKGSILGMLSWACDPVRDEAATRVNVDDLVESGALRSGWVYGMLVAPFKFYPYSGQITASTTIGPYLGWRMERPVGTTTVVGSAGISSVSATAKDESGATKTVPLTAWSAATGLIFEVSKGKTPFRVGFLVGKDWVDRKSAVKYENNARTWLALQLGFDFTDL
jgi:hypothetical protein